MYRNWAVLMGLFESKLYLKSSGGGGGGFILALSLEIMKLALSVYSTAIRVN